jgi:hypothetical protein
MEQDDRIWVHSSANRVGKGYIMEDDEKKTTLPPGYYRVWGRLPENKGQQMKDWAESMGMSLSSFASLAMWIGAKAIMRAASPEDMITEEMWGKILRAAKDNEIDISEIGGDLDEFG